MNKTAIEFIKRFEGFRAMAYLCPANKLTIGYGTTTGVKIGQVVTEAQAEALLVKDLLKFQTKLDELVTARLSDKQEAALLSFIYNVGITAFEISTLRKKLNLGDYQGAAKEFLRWDKVTDSKGIKKPLRGLTIRRDAENKLFLEGTRV